ncbi:MAG: hypothetical protein NT155_00200 [Candidatus Staskawiczbacteria bacterium]|nr:hypothetical protein [Candidatus Staskawiczbacteria bacterium]
MKKVIIIDDKQNLQQSWKNQLQGKAEVVSATSLSQAREQFAAHPDVALVVMDACVDNTDDMIDSIPLTKEIRARFAGPMLATSMSQRYRQKLMESGCDHECGKLDVVRKILEILGA